MIGETRESLTFQAGTTRLEFLRSSDGSPAPFYHFAFNIPENQIENAQQWIKKRTEVLPKDGKEILFFEFWNAHALYFHDPAGNIVELIARHRLSNAVDQPFSAESFLSVRDIGMPVPHVEEAVYLLCRKFAIPSDPFCSETFCPLGDEQGYFVVVGNNRPWLPVETLSVPHPVEVRIAGNTHICHSFANFPYLIES